MLRDDGIVSERCRFGPRATFLKGHPSLSAEGNGANMSLQAKTTGPRYGDGRNDRSIYQKMGETYFALMVMAIMGRPSATVQRYWQNTVGVLKRFRQEMDSAYLPG